MRIKKTTAFSQCIDEKSWQASLQLLESIQTRDVENALNRVGKTHSPKDFLALISPQAKPYLNEMAMAAKRITRQRFGNTVSVFMPMYLSNHCSNICTYCGFSYNNPIPRISLNKPQIEKEINAIKGKGIEQILVLTGEDYRYAHMDYFREFLPYIKTQFRELSLEVQPLTTKEYEEVYALGVDGVYVYQETYRRANYKLYHPKGKKSNFDYRLECPQRAGKSGMPKIGLGVLLGLENWRIDSYFCFLHLCYLKKQFWQSRFSLSFPRLRPASGVYFSEAMRKKFPSEKDLAQLIFAYRLMDEDLLLTLSTRERGEFRDAVTPLGITSLSAESKTNPGGYACFQNEDLHTEEKAKKKKNETSLQQFSISDERSLEAVMSSLYAKGLQPVLKDWMDELRPTTNLKKQPAQNAQPLA